MKRGNRVDPRRIKIHRSYTIEELAQLLGRHKNSVRQWLRQGLEVLADQKRPLLIHGGAARRFLEERRRSNRQKCELHELYCFRCKQARRPGNGTAKYNARSRNCAMLSGLCSECETPMFKWVSASALPALEQLLPVHVSGAARTLKQAA